TAVAAVCLTSGLVLPAASAATADPVIAAAGDIACDPANPAYNGGTGTSSACDQQATSNLLVNQGYSAVLPLGDNQYDDATAAKYQQVYDPTWGRVKSVSHPVPGNHDYLTSGAAGYYGYFGANAGTSGQGYYSYDVGAWHLIALNSNCTIVPGGCAAGSPQETWLRQDLAAHSNTCVLAYWHHALFSSGEDGYNPVTLPFWQDLYAYGADVVLDGHAHEYERFAPQNPQGQVDTTYGVTEFVDGTGGVGFEPVEPQAANSVVLRNGVFGVLQLSLHATSTDFKFVDAAGSSGDSGTVNCHGAPPATGPATPTGVDGTTGNGQVTVSWTPVSGQVSSYTVTASPGGATVTVPGSAATAVVPGLANGTAYTFVVTATNSAGTSLPSTASRPITPVAPPTDGTYLSQVLQDAPAGFWRLDETSTAAPAADASGNGRTGSYSGGVTLGQAGATAGGTAAAYDGSSGATTVPDASPLRLNGGFTIEFWAKMTSFVNSWPGLLRKGAAGTADGYVVWYTSNGTLHFKRGNLDVATPAGALTTSGYKHFALVDDGSTATWYVNGAAVSSGQLAASLSAGTDPLVLGQGDQAGKQALDDVAVYNRALPAARIAAHVNAAPVVASAPATAPGAPTSVSATAGNASATVSWVAPASDGGSAITSYTVRSSGGQVATVNGTTLSATVTGLTNGTPYTFTVTATNSAGTGPASAASNAVTPVAVPDAPTGVTATRGNASATVSWTAPASSGGSAITSYTVRSNAGQVATVDGSTLSTTVTGLTNGTSYTFTVTATNSAGTGPASAPSNAVTPATVPGAPTSVSATAANASATVSWAAPASNGGSAITGYTVTSSAGQVATVNGTTLSATVTGLTNGTSYTFTVTATNAVGPGPASAASNAVTPVAVPGAPTGVTATRGNASATVSWTAPASSGGSAITSYTVRSSAGQVATVDGNTLSATVTGLTNGTSYTFTVTATNSAGAGPASAPSNAVTPATVPGAPTSVSATAANASASVSWAAPASNGGSAITSYVVKANDGTTVTVGGTTLSTTLTGLTNGIAYTFTVTATNALGSGPASAASNAVTPQATSYASAVLGDQPIAYFRLGEKSGATTAADASGHTAGSYTGVTLGVPGALPHDSDTAALFDGATSAVSVADSPALRLNGSFTIEFWAKLKTFMNTYPGLMIKGASATANGYLVWYTSDGALHFKRNNVDVATPAGVFNTSAWHDYAVSYDGSTLRWYVDGQAVSSRAVTFPTNAGTDPLKLGRGDRFGNDYLDEVAVYASALTPTRVGAHFSAA
ncbi:MAG: trimeric autotransporter adhesin, partial [Frankiaceae bacterium]|nr:trimeric autotransporter adhesin [Frankiaceae bacterium]